MTNYADAREQEIRLLCKYLAELLIKKHLDYGTDNLDKHGLLGIRIRIDDKIARLNNLADGAKQNVSESIEDTLFDLAGYAIQGVIQSRRVPHGDALQPPKLFNEA